MHKELLHTERLAITINRRNRVTSTKRKILIKKILINGSNLFKKYNYYIFVLGFTILYLTFEMYLYFNSLNKNLNDDYYNFLQQVYVGGIAMSTIFGILYVYAIVSYMSYPALFKKIKREAIDPIIINFIYFFILLIEFYLKKIYGVLPSIFMISLPPIIALFYFRHRKITLYFQSYNDIILRTLFFSIFAFFVINSQHVIYSFYLINNDLKDKFAHTINEVIGEKKQEVISNIIEKINNKNINNKQISVYNKGNETHFVIKNFEK